jgi:hypothetical protein
MTTIGYGDMRPQTDSGRLFLIFFAIFGADGTRRCCMWPLQHPTDAMAMHRSCEARNAGMAATGVTLTVMGNVIRNGVRPISFPVGKGPTETSLHCGAATASLGPNFLPGTPRQVCSRLANGLADKRHAACR